jgi:hypothetical protein
MHQRQIARLQPVHVTEHLRFGVVRIENRMREKRRGSLEALVVA